MSKNLKCGVVSEVQCKWFTEASGCGIPEGEECTVERYAKNNAVVKPIMDGDTLVCSHCGFKVREYDNYCSYCGTRLKHKLEV